MKTTIGLDSRLAMRLLASSECKVKLNTDSLNDTYTTKQGVLYTGHSEEVFIKELNAYVDVLKIGRIEYTDRFGLTSFMSIAWAD